MPIRYLVQYPDERLTTESSVVTEFDDKLHTLIDDLISTLYGTTGIGLSAPQIGVLQQVMVSDLSDDRSSAQVYVNPQIVAKSGFAIAHESCLSLPGIEAKVIRSAIVHVKALDKYGVCFEQELSGMDAICMQHEVDHLQGTLFIDRISSVRRWLLRARLNDLRQKQPELKYIT